MPDMAYCQLKHTEQIPKKISNGFGYIDLKKFNNNWYITAILENWPMGVFSLKQLEFKYMKCQRYS